MKTSILEYSAGGTSFKGYLAFEESSEKKPIVLISSTWRGLNSFTREKAHYIASLGYIAFAIDLYGDGKIADNDEEAAKLMMPLFLNRPLLVERLKAAFDTAQKIPGGNPSKMGAIGFCFGGLTVIELLMSGVDVNAVSFHGVLADSSQGHTATLAPQAKTVKGSLLLLHGYKDPLVPMEDVVKLEQKLATTEVDWQINIYGDAGHSFTNPDLKDHSTGMYFEPCANKRSFLAMENFFKEKFNEPH